MRYSSHLHCLQLAPAFCVVPCNWLISQVLSQVVSQLILQLVAGGFAVDSAAGFAGCLAAGFAAGFTADFAASFAEPPTFAGRLLKHLDTASETMAAASLAVSAIAFTGAPASIACIAGCVRSRGLHRSGWASPIQRIVSCKGL